MADLAQRQRTNRKRCLFTMIGSTQLQTAVDISIDNPTIHWILHNGYLTGYVINDYKVIRIYRINRYGDIKINGK